MSKRPEFNNENLPNRLLYVLLAELIRIKIVHRSGDKYTWPSNYTFWKFGWLYKMTTRLVKIRGQIYVAFDRYRKTPFIKSTSYPRNKSIFVNPKFIHNIDYTIGNGYIELKQTYGSGRIQFESDKERDLWLLEKHSTVDFKQIEKNIDNDRNLSHDQKVQHKQNVRSLLLKIINRKSNHKQITKTKTRIVYIPMGGKSK